MTTEGIVTLAGTVVTLFGMAVTIWQALQARNYKNQIKFNLRKIDLEHIIERLKRAQDDIRRLPTSLQNIPRGIRPIDLIHKIREQFDMALSTLDVAGPDAGIRGLLIEGQHKLNSYEISWNSGTPNPQDVHELQAKMMCQHFPGHKFTQLSSLPQRPAVPHIR